MSRALHWSTIDNIFASGLFIYFLKSFFKSFLNKIYNVKDIF